jgi:hypothetical protein
MAGQTASHENHLVLDYLEEVETSCYLVAPETNEGQELAPPICLLVSVQTHHSPVSGFEGASTEAAEVVTLFTGLVPEDADIVSDGHWKC